jgi:nucleotide-binding universal stress UspA family protein
MIKKIICPTDFSTTATHATEYGAKLAQLLGAELLFINVQRPLSISAHASSDEDSKIVTQMVTERLKEMCIEIHKMFSISAKYEVETSTMSLEKILVPAGVENAMIVIGTDGNDNLYKYLFGSTTLRLLKKAKCPVLIIHEKASYRNIGKIVFAWDYNSGNKSSFSTLTSLFKPIDPWYSLLHVSTHRPASSHEVFTMMRHEMEATLEKESKLDFEQLFLSDIPQGINDYMIKSKAEILALTYYNRTLFHALFHGEVAKRILRLSDYPILILHS